VVGAWATVSTASGRCLGKSGSRVDVEDIRQVDWELPLEVGQTAVFGSELDLIWSPIAPLDIGVEYLWGSRKNKDGNKGTANQLQIVATFNF